MIDNKNIVLTGASSGIGFEVLKLLVQGRGNRILAVSRTAEEKLSDFDVNVIPMSIDVSSAEAVDRIFERAAEVFDGKKIDIFYANAGYPYYEQYNYTDWDRVKRMFETNTFSPIYTYSKYLEHLAGREGILAITVSAIGQMAMPGYAIYSSTKFALHGFQQAVRIEKPKNLQLTCLYPVATDTNFFKVANEVEFEKPFPVQTPDVVARKMVKGIEKGKKTVSPCALFALSKVLMGICPPVRTVYWKLENNKLERFKKKLEGMGR
ncbi:MAG: SDR family NAD(P)-dependent oxidoreductase [Ruminococcaceae bacterium]|nr:SDR family NAD(P)-dependent oxidoreductase [Oscillospiraceae bacterium]